MVATRRAGADEAAEEPKLDQPQQETAGRSLRQIVWARVRRDRVAIVSLSVLIFMYGMAIIGPFVAPFFGFDPYKFDPTAISGSGGNPVVAVGRHQPGSTHSVSSGAPVAISSASCCGECASRC